MAVTGGLARGLTAEGGGAGSWTPADITTAAWFDASDADTITSSGDDVTDWDDKSGNGNHAEQLAAAQQPQNTGSLNGVDCFDMAGDWITFLTGTMPTTYDIFIAARSVGSASNVWLGGPGSTFIPLGIGGTSTELAWVGGSAPAGMFSYFNGSTSEPADREAARVIMNNTLGAVYRGKDTPNIPVSATLGGATSTFNTLGQFCEAVFVESPSDSDAAKVEGYLAWKWGMQTLLASGHDYEDAAP